MKVLIALLSLVGLALVPVLQTGNPRASQSAQRLPIPGSGPEQLVVAGGVPSGYMILGDTQTPPAGYTFTGGGVVSSLSSWASEASMPTARQWLAVASVNGKIYAIGGMPTGVLTPLATSEEYDPATNTWTSKAPMLTARYGLGAAVLYGRVYAIGGSSGSTVEEYDPVSNSWASKAPMPVGWSGTGVTAVAAQGIIYANTGSAFYLYNPFSNSWSSGSSIPTSRGYAAMAELNGKLYVLGGYNGSDLDLVQVWDVNTATWSTKASMPTARFGLTAVAMNGKIYAIGGFHSASPFYLQTVEEYDPATDSWTIKAPMPTARWLLAAEVVNEKAYAFGGSTLAFGSAAPAFSTVERFEPTRVLYVHKKN